MYDFLTDRSSYVIVCYHNAQLTRVVKTDCLQCATARAKIFIPDLAALFAMRKSCLTEEAWKSWPTREAWNQQGTHSIKTSISLILLPLYQNIRCFCRLKYSIKTSYKVDVFGVIAN